MRVARAWDYYIKDIIRKDNLFDGSVRGISYPIILEIGAIERNDPKFKKIKEDMISKLKMKNNTNKKPIENLLKCAQKNSMPILTTNYDNFLMDVLMNGTKYKARTIHSDYKFSSYYPWSTYYSKESIDETNIRNEFAIWHIHGDVNYKNSIRLGLLDYSNLIQHLNTIGPDYNDTNNKWKGRKTWLDIFFNCNLIIYGLTLDFQEVDLYWLFVKRQKYLLSKGLCDSIRTIFILNQDYDDTSDSRKNLLKELGMEVRVMSGKEIYDNDYKIIKGE